MTSKSKQIFILSGQSNMSGRGGVTKNPHNHHKQWNGVVPPECHPHPSIHRLNALLHWEQAREPLHVDIDSKKVCGVGPGMPFVNAVMARVEGTQIGLVPCAVGGTAIKEWARGSHLYESMVKRARFAVEEGGGEIMAVLWFQGESDTCTAEVAAAYRERLEKLIWDLREDLKLPLLPFIQVAITSGEKYVEEIRAVQLGMKLPNVICVDAKGLKLKSDNLHLSTEAQVQLGLMLADAYFCHFQPPPLSPEKHKLCSDSKGLDI